MPELDYNAPWPEAPEREKKRILQAVEMRAILTLAGVDDARIHCPDVYYSFPTVAWIKGAFADGLQKLLSSTQFKFEDEAQDCDNFAEMARVYAQWCHSGTGPQDDPQRIQSALAFGTFEYQPDKEMQRHAINVFISDSSRGLQPHFFEPQTCRLRPLTSCEIRSCSFCRV